MILKTLKSNNLAINYEYLSDEGKTLKKKQNFNFMPLESETEDLYEVASDIGNMLKAAPKSIEQNTVFLLTEE